eukprot:GHVT01043979.1.p1 GENE.GHVT01043979.1~~GHVT01043979.1.p1  ORF type:complete len:430 (+),score=35.95 GHVT01043979.1:394-1683(+)
MAEPLASPDFARKSVGPTKAVKGNGNGHSRSAPAGALSKKLAPSSSRGEWSITWGQKVLLTFLVISSGLVAAKLLVPDGPQLQRQGTSPPKLQVGPGVQAAAATNLIAPLVARIDAPTLRPAPPAATDDGRPPKAPLPSLTEMNDLRECLSVQAGLGASNSRLVARDLLSSRRRLTPGRRLITLAGCAKLVRKYQFLILLVFCSVALMASAVQADYYSVPQNTHWETCGKEPHDPHWQKCFRCGCENMEQYYSGSKCLQFEFTKKDEGLGVNDKDGWSFNAYRFITCPDTDKKSSAVQADCAPNCFATTLSCIRKTIEDGLMRVTYDVRHRFFTLGSWFLNFTDSGQLPFCPDRKAPFCEGNSRKCIQMMPGTRNALIQPMPRATNAGKAESEEAMSLQILNKFFAVIAIIFLAYNRLLPDYLWRFMLF